MRGCSMPKGKKTQEQIDKKELADYFASICSCDMNYAIFYTQLKKIMEDNPNITYKGLKYTLWYCKEHQNMSITSIGIAPYYYNEAKEYHKWLSGIKKYMAEYKGEDRVVTLNRVEQKEVIFD